MKKYISRYVDTLWSFVGRVACSNSLLFGPWKTLEVDLSLISQLYFNVTQHAIIFINILVSLKNKDSFSNKSTIFRTK